MQQIIPELICCSCGSHVFVIQQICSRNARKTNSSALQNTVEYFTTTNLVLNCTYEELQTMHKKLFQNGVKYVTHAIINKYPLTFS